MNFNDTMKQVENLVEEFVGDKNKLEVRARLGLILRDAFCNLVAHKTKDRLILNKERPASKIMSVSQVIKEDWELVEEDDNRLVYEKI